VLGGGLAKDCEVAAENAANKQGVPDSAFESCNLAISAQVMSIHDLAATYTNRGILSLVKPNYAAAVADFDAAISLLPSLGGAYCDRGAALIAQNRFAEGIAEIDRGLALNSPEPERSYFNRGLAREQLGDIKGAYEDLQTAAGLNPTWTPPRQELVRFQVKPRTY
jgi:tetratricopeptide (TPR) repeat protein